MNTILSTLLLALGVTLQADQQLVDVVGTWDVETAVANGRRHHAEGPDPILVRREGSRPVRRQLLPPQRGKGAGKRAPAAPGRGPSAIA